MQRRPKMILASGTRPTIERWSDEVVRVATPLDAIMRLERMHRHDPIRTVILAGGFASDPELVRFLGVFYPRVRVECEL